MAVIVVREHRVLVVLCRFVVVLDVPNEETSPYE